MGKPGTKKPPTTKQSVEVAAKVAKAVALKTASSSTSLSSSNAAESPKQLKPALSNKAKGKLKASADEDTKNKSKAGPSASVKTQQLKAALGGKPQGIFTVLPSPTRSVSNVRFSAVSPKPPATAGASEKNPQQPTPPAIPTKTSKELEELRAFKAETLRKAEAAKTAVVQIPKPPGEHGRRAGYRKNGTFRQAYLIHEGMEVPRKTVKSMKHDLKEILREKGIPRSAFVTKGRHSKKFVQVFLAMEKKWPVFENDKYKDYWPIFDMAAELTDTQRNHDNRKKRQAAQGSDDGDDGEDEEPEGDAAEEDGEGEGEEESESAEEDEGEEGEPWGEAGAKTEPDGDDVEPLEEPKPSAVPPIKQEPEDVNVLKATSSLGSLFPEKLEKDGFEIKSVQHQTDKSLDARKDPDGHASAVSFGDRDRPMLENQELWAKLGPVLANYAIDNWKVMVEEDWAEYTTIEDVRKWRKADRDLERILYSENTPAGRVDWWRTQFAMRLPVECEREVIWKVFYDGHFGPAPGEQSDDGNSDERSMDVDIKPDVHPLKRRTPPSPAQVPTPPSKKARRDLENDSEDAATASSPLTAPPSSPFPVPAPKKKGPVPRKVTKSGSK